MKDLKKVKSLKKFIDFQNPSIWLETDNFLVNEFLGGGIPLTRLIELSGIESTGKTAFGMWLLGQIQKNKGTVAYFDIERSATPDRVKHFLDLDELIFDEDEIVEEVFPSMQKFIMDYKSKNKPLGILLDSIGNLVIKDEDESDFEKDGMFKAKRASLISKGLRVCVVPYMADNNVCCIFINQVIASMKMFGKEYETPGGRGLKHNASIRLEFTFKKSNFIKENEKVVGLMMEIKTAKNKLAGRNESKLFVPLYFDERTISNTDTILANIDRIKECEIENKKSKKSKIKKIEEVVFDDVDELEDDLEKLKKDLNDDDEEDEKVKKLISRNTTYNYNSVFNDEKVSLSFTKKEFKDTIYEQYKEMFHNDLKKLF